MTVVSQSRSFDLLGLELGGDVALPESPIGVVLFARVPGGRSDDERDLRVSRELNMVHVATVRVNLLTAAEQRVDAATAELRFDADLLGMRTIAMIDRLASDGATAGLPGGLLGAHSASAGCLIAAAARPQWVRAVASPGGRPDLDGESSSSHAHRPCSWWRVRHGAPRPERGRRGSHRRSHWSPCSTAWAT